ncbi:hypothetical protein I204_07418 [Kwoniella mangroviensis CBS 8886]|nr:hypothetical protein I204_07418 [Kwoniella mangroviensis CBS 8886]
MSTSATTSNATSPSNNTAGAGQDQEALFSLDFLALAGLDSGMSNNHDITSPTNSNQQNHPIHGNSQSQKDVPEHNHSQYLQQQLHQWENNPAGPSSTSQNSSTTVTRNPSADAENDIRSKHGMRSDTENAMDLDQPDIDRMAQQEGYNLVGDKHDYDAAQAALLQQQSPLGFDINSPQFPLAQMFLASPASQVTQLQQYIQNENGNQDGQKLRHRGSVDKAWANGLGGMPTPGPSGELIPQNRQEAMSPIHLEMLACAQSEFGGDPNMLPLLSPALSQSTSNSFNSPSTQIAFNSQPPAGQSHSNGANRSPLEQLQEQQRQFQEQLAMLQQRQLEMQATAAAVVAASNSSPFIGSNPPSAGPSRGVSTSGAGVTPNSGFFSPLTSPALEAPHRASQQHMHRQHFSPAFNAQQSRTPHPLSALSSPALNPVGSSGGAQQTLSPALGPQTGADLSDPDYLRALVGMLDGDPHSIGQPAQPNYQSPSMGSSSSAGHSTILASPALIPINSGAGPHRHSLPAKSRPSPMLKPTNHRSHQRVPSGTTMNGNGTYSVPTSPAVQKFHPNPPPNMINMGYLPPSAIEHRNLAPSGASMSSASTPSPVDLSHMMPPPPVPNNGSTKSRKGVAPMTPASLMNLASAPHVTNHDISLDEHTGHSAVAPPPPPPKRGPSGTSSRIARKQNGTNGNTVGGSGNKKSAAKSIPVGGGKRALAIRPQSAASSKAAAKAPPPPSEPENRKTSHKAAEQKRRDSLKAGFDELRMLLPPINVEALDPESGEPIPGSSAPRLLPKSSLVPDDNPNRGVSKVALLRFGNEYIEKLKERVERRDDYIERLREEVRRLRIASDDLGGEDEEGEGDILEFDWREGEEDEFDPPPNPLDEDILLDENGELLEEGDDDAMRHGDGEDDEMLEDKKKINKQIGNRRSKSFSISGGTGTNNPTKSPALRAINSKRPSITRGSSSTATVTVKK